VRVGPGIARYDGHAEWYDETFSAFHTEAAESWFRECLGPGGGAVCLDVACGTGRSGRVLREADYRAVGFDISADQLRFARSRLAAAVRADARRLPLPDASADVATGMYVHTDTEDFAAVVREVARCLRPGGRFAYLGVHPCYVGPFVYRLDERRDQTLTFTPGYGTVGWAGRASGDGSRIGGRVGFHHKTLASFLQAFGDAGLVLSSVREFTAPEGGILPWDLALLAEKPRQIPRASR
jgi:SAM-dependent methyltransferase